MYSPSSFFEISLVGANGCTTSVADDDPIQKDAIQCCHQHEQIETIDPEENCSRWLCDGCRVKLKISTNDIWFCSDHVDMYDDENEN